MEIPFWCVIAVSEMKREFSFLYHRTHCSFWQIPNIGMLMVCSRSVRKFPSNFIYMVSVTEEFYPPPPKKTKTGNTYNKLFEQLFQLINTLGNVPNDVLVDFERSVINAFQNVAFMIFPQIFGNVFNIKKKSRRAVCSTH